MWRTPTGDRTLVGAEAALIREAIGYVVDTIRDEAEGDTEIETCGVTLFDELSWRQRLALLVEVTRALLDPRVAAPELSAVNEATVAALFAHIRQNIAFEIDVAREPEVDPEFDPHSWRRLVAACQNDGDLDEQIESTCADEDEWDLLLQVLEDEILWDQDWDMPELFLDVDPELSRLRKQLLQIPDNYFCAPAPDVSDQEAPATFAAIEQALRI